MITGTLKSQVDTSWNAFWSGGIANPLGVIEQTTSLSFLRRLDEEQTLARHMGKAALPHLEAGCLTPRRST